MSMSKLQRAAKIKLFFAQYYDDFCFETIGPEAITTCSCGCQNTLSSWISTCSRQDIDSTRHEVFGKIEQFCRPYDRLSTVFYSLLTDRINAVDGEQFWRGNWQPWQIDRITNVVIADSNHGYSSDSLWFTRSFKRIKKCLAAIMDGALKMRSISQDRIAIVHTV